MSQNNTEEVIIDEAGQTLCVQNKDFKDYVARKDLKIEDIRRLSLPKKREFYLRWKHGMTENSVNEELENSLQKFLFDFKDANMEDVPPYYRTQVRMRRAFDTYCYSIKQQIGLVNQSEMPAEVRAIARQVGGKVTGYEYQ